jgi:hypothetical protein
VVTGIDTGVLGLGARSGGTLGAFPFPSSLCLDRGYRTAITDRGDNCRNLLCRSPLCCLGNRIGCSFVYTRHNLDMNGATDCSLVELHKFHPEIHRLQAVDRPKSDFDPCLHDPRIHQSTYSYSPICSRCRGIKRPFGLLGNRLR